MQLFNVGLCAFGMSGRVFHAPFLKQHPGFHIAGIVERSKNDSREFYPEAMIYRSIEELLEVDYIDIVVINTPIQTHFDYCKKAIHAGKHVIIEKPFTIDTQEAEELCKLADEKGVFLSVFQNRRFDRDFLQVEKILQQKILGEIKEVEIRFDRYRTTPGTKIHKENPDLKGSGAWHDLGSHLVDQAMVLFGKPESLFADIFSMKGKDTANDYFEILMFYPNQMRLRLKSSVFTKEDHFAYKIHGHYGSFLQERSDRQEDELVGGKNPIFNENWVENMMKSDGILHYIDNENNSVREELWSEPSSYMYYFQEIYEHLVFDDELPFPGKEIVLNMQIIDAALESSGTGTRIYL